MAYQESSYGPRSTYAGPTNNAGHFPQSHQQQSQFYPNPHPQSNHFTPPSAPVTSYTYPQPSSEPQTYQAQRQQQYGPNQNQNQHQHLNGGGPLMQPPTGLPDDHFKKPYLPQQQYLNHGQPPANFIDNQRQNSSASEVTAALGPAQAYSGASTNHKRLHDSGSSYPPTSTMTVSATPINPPSTQSTPISEVPSQSTDHILQPGGLSSLDQQRVDALLQVNNLLLQEVTILQKVGLKPSPQSPQQTAPTNTSPQATPAPPTSAGDPTSTPQNQNNSATKSNPTTATTPTTTTPTTATAPQQQSLNTKKYVEFMTRIKTNIMFLVNISDQAKDSSKPRPPYPSHLEAPPLWLNPGNEEGDKQLDSLREEYARLRELWPDWKPEVRRPHAGGGQQAQQGQQQQQQMQQMQQPQVQQQS